MLRSTKTHATQLPATQVWDEKTRRTPQPHQRTIRRDELTCVTTGFGGKTLPVKMIPLLREDAVLNSTIALNFQMAELSNMILNPIRATAYAYFVPKLVQDRFQDMGSIDRSYNGLAEVDGTVIPWFDQATFTQPLAGDGTADIYKTLGLHAPNGSAINTDYVESYNAMWNYIARNRSESLELRDALDTTLAPAFWEHTDMKFVVPNFDDAMMEGWVPITFTNGTSQLPVMSVGEVSSSGKTGPGMVSPPPPPDDGVYDWTGNVWAEMADAGASMSIANIDYARETQAWARARNQYAGLSEEWMMDQLLQGIRVNDTALRDPILLAHGSTAIGMNERYATDAENLDQSVVDGQSTINLNLRLPQVSCGGTIVVCAQVLPEQIFERQRDHYFRATDITDLPNRTADELDLQPVDFKKCGEVDESHSTPEDLFGYEPLNAKWNRTAPRVGGRYYQPDPNAAWTEVRNRLWDTNVVDPQLGTDFYTATDIKHDVFKSSNTDPFEIWAAGSVQIQGLTYFEGPLLEATDDYEKVQAQVSTDRLKGDGTDTAPVSE